MTWQNVRETIRETVAADPHSSRLSGRRKAWREGSGTGAIGTALRCLHGPTTDEPLPPDLLALLRALETAERKNRA